MTIVLRLLVSIHTPTQGVTSLQYHKTSLNSFNPHTHAGCDQLIIVSIVHLLRFNPHTHAGCDTVIRNSTLYLFVSIHTPTQGVTAAIHKGQAGNRVSIHTPTQGVTAQSMGMSRVERSFNPHTHAGCDMGKSFFQKRIVFQSTHPRRVWRSVRQFY